MRTQAVHERVKTPSKPVRVVESAPTSTPTYRRIRTPPRDDTAPRTPHILGSGTLKKARPEYRDTRSLASVSRSPTSTSKRSIQFSTVIDSQITKIRGQNSPSQASSSSSPSSTKIAYPKVIIVSDSDDTDTINVPDSDSDTDSEVDAYFPLSRDHFSGSSGATSSSSIGSQPSIPGSLGASNGRAATVPKSSNSAKPPSNSANSDDISNTNSRKLIIPPPSPTKGSHTEFFRGDASPAQAPASASAFSSRPARGFDLFSPRAPVTPQQPKPTSPPPWPRAASRVSNTFSAPLQASQQPTLNPLPQSAAPQAFDLFSQPAPGPPQPKPASLPEPSAAPRAAIDPAIVDFLQQPLGTELKPYVIAHDTQLQELFDNLKIEWGVQYQVARGQSHGLWNWDEVVAKVDKLKGTNEEVCPNVANIIKGEGGSGTDPKVWAELDREQAAILENEGRMFGLMGVWKGIQNWHGGQVQQLARLIEKGGNLKVVLEPLEKRRSHRFARFGGSRRILQLRVPDSLLQSIPDKVRAFLAQRFILLGRTFVPFHCKDGSVYMVETNQDWERKGQEWCGDQHRRSFVEFMEWHNPMALNAGQAISKFVTRYALGLSNSIPVIEFAKENIIFIHDVNSSDWPVDNPKAPTEKIMTDGCGYINLAALTIITRQMGYESAPTALQARIDGSKGLWIRHPTDISEEPKIWIRDSQNKIKNPVLDRGHRILELVAPSKASTSVALSMQSILNLYHNDVSEEVIVKLFREGLKDDIAPLLKWDSMVLLYDAVTKAGGISGARLARLAAGASVALGLQRNQWGHDDVDSQEDEEQDELEPLTYTGRNPYSGAPHALHENLLEMIQAGFHPRESKTVQDKLKQVIKTAVTSAVEKYRIPLKDSISAWLVPDPFAEVLFPENRGRGEGPGMRDPLGLLKEGEVYFRSSQPLKDLDSELAYHVITGDVVLGRYPMRLPSDLQKATAIDRPEYALYTDVLIVSVNGTSSLPSFLSGGDMDGDIVNIFRDPDIVRYFNGKPLTEAPADLETNFEKEVVQVKSFCSRAATMSPAEAQKWYQDFLLANVVSEQKGLYSMFHDNAVATLGYDNSQTIRLAYIFNALLDASKTGLRLKDGIFDTDKKKYGKKPEPFGILARLKEEGVVIEEELMVMFREAIDAVPVERDPSRFRDSDLLKPYTEALEKARSLHDRGRRLDPSTLRYSRVANEADDRGDTIGLGPVGKHAFLAEFMNEELKLIRKHVEAAKAIFDREFGRKMSEDSHQTLFLSPSKGGKLKKAGGSFSGTGKNDQDDLMLQATKKFGEPIEGLDIYASNVEEMKASYAYYMLQSTTARFPWTVAFRELCAIKAKAKGIAPVIREIDECKNVSSSAVKVLAKKSEAVVF